MLLLLAVGCAAGKTWHFAGNMPKTMFGMELPALAMSILVGTIGIQLGWAFKDAYVGVTPQRLLAPCCVPRAVVPRAIVPRAVVSWPTSACGALLAVAWASTHFLLRASAVRSTHCALLVHSKQRTCMLNMHVPTRTAQVAKLFGAGLSAELSLIGLMLSIVAVLLVLDQVDARKGKSMF